MVPHSSKFPSMSESHHSALGASRVLLVDDDRLSLKVAQMALEKAGMEVDSFTNPEEALAYFEEHPMGYYTCLLTDYSMPEMTGVELLAALRQRDEFLSCIVITARDEQDIVRDSYRRGALDMLGKPVDLRELLRVMRLACKKTALTRKEAETVAGVEEAGRNERVITMPMPPELEGRLSIYYRPRHAIGGDFYLCQKQDAERNSVLLGDVSGHTIKSALLSSYFQGFIQGQSLSTSNFIHGLQTFNRLLNRSNDEAEGNRNSISLCQFSLSNDGRTVEYINCGFEAPLTMQRSGEVRVWEEGTFALGWFDELSAVATEEQTQNDAFLYSATDGLIDHADDIGVNAWSLAYYVMESEKRDKHEDRILSRTRDDILSCRFQLTPDVSKEDLPQLVFYDNIPGSDLERINDLQKSFAESINLVLGQKFEDRQYDVTLCFREGIINALKYGCQKSADLSAEVTGYFIEATTTLGIIIHDPGAGHDFDINARRQDLESDLPGSKHLGLVMMHDLPDTTRTRRQGSWVCMEFDLKDRVESTVIPFFPSRISDEGAFI